MFAKTVCHEKNSCQVGHLMGGLRNFERDGGRSTAYGVQAQCANHFVRLGGKPTGRERQLEGWCESVEVSIKEMNASEPLMRCR